MANPTPKDIPAKLLRRLYDDEGLTGYQIAERLGEAQATVYRRLKALGLSRRGRRNRDESVSFLDELRPGLPVRIAVEGDRPGFNERLRRVAKRLGFRLTIAKDGDGHVLVTRVPRKHVARSEWVGTIRHLYCEEGWRVRPIAAKLGLSRKHVYELIKSAGIQLEDRGKRPPIEPIERSDLERLYLAERLSVPAIAKRLKVTPRDVARGLERHRTWPGARVPGRLDFPQLARLSVWEGFTVGSDSHAVRTKLSREAKWHNIRVAVRSIGPGRCRVTRLPFLTEEAVKGLLDSGLSATKVARKLRVLPPAIKHLLPHRSEPGS